MKRVIDSVIGLLFSIFSISILGCGSGNLLRKESNINYKHLAKVLDVINETAIDEGFQQLAILNFSDSDGRTTIYSRNFNTQLYKKISLFDSQQYNVISQSEFRDVLNKLQIEDFGFIQSADLQRLHKEMPTLDAIVTGAVSLKEGPKIIFFKSNGEILHWQREITKIVSDLVDTLKEKAIEPLAVSQFVAENDGKPNGFSKYMTAIVRYELVKAGIDVISPEEIPKIVEQWKLQHSGITDDQTAVEIGNLVNARSTLTGSVSGNLSSSWNINAKLMNVVTGIIEWEDNLLSAEDQVIQFNFPFALTDEDSLLLNDNERRLIHSIISDENLSYSEKDYYVTSVVSLARIRRNSEIDADTRFASYVSSRLEKLDNDLKYELTQKIKSLKETEEENSKKRENERDRLLAEFLENEKTRMRREHDLAISHLLQLKNLVGPKNYAEELGQIIEQLGKILAGLETYTKEQQLPAKEGSN